MDESPMKQAIYFISQEPAVSSSHRAPNLTSSTCLSELYSMCSTTQDDEKCTKLMQFLVHMVDLTVVSSGVPEAGKLGL